MPWIESHTVLLHHRKLIELARDLRLKPAHCMGHLHALWHAALEQREDGDLSSWSDDFIAAAADYSGDAPLFVSLLRTRGWLDGALIHDWLDYAGRYLTAKYKTRDRERLSAIWSKHGRVYGKPGSEREVKGKYEVGPPLVGLVSSPPDQKGNDSVSPPRDNETPSGLAWNYRARKRHGLILDHEDEATLAVRFQELIDLGVSGPTILAEIRREGRRPGETIWKMIERLEPKTNGHGKPAMFAGLRDFMAGRDPDERHPYDPG